MTQSIVCGGCGAGVRYGRLSCPECGEMLATVAGAARRPTSIASVGDPVDVAAGALPGTDDAAAPGSAVALAVPRAPGVLHDASEPIPTADVRPTTGPDAVAELDGPEPPEPVAATYLADPEPEPEPVAATYLADPEPEPEPVVAAVAAQPFPPEPAGAAGSATVAEAGDSVPWTAAAATPGAYLPPQLQPAGPPAPARAWAGHGALDVAASGPVAAGSEPASTDASTHAASSTARSTEFVGWLAIAGGALSAAGFLLPWSSFSVIGADGAGYFDLWGLAGPGHSVVVLAVLGIIAAAAARERVPLWLGIGLPGLGVGALLVGLVWPYLLALPGAQVGAMAVLLGALLLVGAGLAALILDRHARGPRVV